MMASSAIGRSQTTYEGQRLFAVKGDVDKVNDVYVFGKVSGCQEHVIYFGGDVQDYPENMARHRDNKRYTEWNTEKTAEKIHRKTPDSLVFVIKPTSMHLMTFAVYSNFVEANAFGSPTHSTDYGAVRHLACLYASLVKEIHGITNMEDFKIPVRIMGFSKGCTVLNQIVFELPAIESLDCQSKSFLQKIKSFYWLDGGHSGGTENTWVTSDAPLQRLASLDCEIHIHVTPYQVRDPMRKWIGQQQSKFYKKLKEFGARVQAIEHFENEPRDIENHFRVLEEFT